MKIYGVCNISNNNSKVFSKELMDTVASFEKQGYQVEIQYSTNTSQLVKGVIVYSALVIGRR